MNSGSDQLGTLAREFVLLSLVTFGGFNTVLPEMHRQAVEVHHWMTDADFAQLFAIAQAAPGPNFMIVTLIGWHTAGLAGAVVTTLAAIVPTFTLSYFVAGAWQRFREAHWRKALQAGIIPVTVGLVAAAAFVLMETALDTWPLLAVTLGTMLVVLKTKVHPLATLAVAGTLGYFGLL